MKFRDGQWLPAEGVTAAYAEEVYAVTERKDGKALELLCPTKKILSRGNTLDSSTLTIVSILAAVPNLPDHCNRTLKRHLTV